MSAHDKAIEAACLACWADAAEFHQTGMRRAIAAFLRSWDCPNNFDRHEVVGAALETADELDGGGT